MHARLGDADLTGEQIVEIAERLEEHEEVSVPGEVSANGRVKTRQRLPILRRSSTPPRPRFRASRSRMPIAGDEQDLSIPQY